MEMSGFPLRVPYVITGSGCPRRSMSTGKGTSHRLCSSAARLNCCVHHPSFGITKSVFPTSGSNSFGPPRLASSLSARAPGTSSSTDHLWKELSQTLISTAYLSRPSETSVASSSTSMQVAAGIRTWSIMKTARGRFDAALRS